MTFELCGRIVSSNSKLKQHPTNVAKQGYKKVSDFDLLVTTHNSYMAHGSDELVTHRRSVLVFKGN